MSYSPLQTIYLVSFQATAGTTYQVVGARAFIALIASSTRKFKAVIQAPAGFTGYCRLVDLTSGGTELVVLSTAATVPTAVEGTFTPLGNGERVYTVELKSNGSPTEDDRVVCYSANVEIAH